MEEQELKKLIDAAEKRGYEKCKTDEYSAIRAEMAALTQAHELVNSAEKSGEERGKKQGRVEGLRESIAIAQASEGWKGAKLVIEERIEELEKS